jgi:hypothetical protein
VVLLSLVSAVAAILAALWARSGARALDGFAAITLPLLVRVKHRVDPDPMVETVVAAAAAAPPPAILERAEPAAAPPVSAAALPVIVTEDELRERAPLVEPDEHSPTIPMAAPRSRVTPVAAPLGSEPPAGEPPETGPSRSGERARQDGDERAAGYFTAYVVPTEPPRSDLPPSSMTQEALGVPDAAAERRRRAHELGQATERQRQLDARKKREAEQVARQVGLLSDEEAARPSGEGFAMDRPSWEGRTAVHDQASLQAELAAPAPPVAAPRPALASPPAPPPPAPPPPTKPRAKADSSPTLLSEGVIAGPRQRHDPRAEPVSSVDVRVHGAG